MSQAPKAQRKRKQKEESDSENEAQGEDVILTGGVDQMGAYDDSQFQEADESAKRKKDNNIVRKLFYVI